MCRSHDEGRKVGSLRNLEGSAIITLLHNNRAVGRELVAAAQSELTIGNLVRRVLFLIREEYVSQVKYVYRCASLHVVNADMCCKWRMYVV
jgi:hypothetical protein